MLLKPGGRIVLEFPYAMDLIENTEFDTIYHEHVFYFSVTPLIPLFARHGLEILHIERLPIHGGSLRLFAGLAGAHTRNSSVSSLLRKETEKGISTAALYQGFAERVFGIRDTLVRTCQDQKRRSMTLAAYGASAKGSTLLNFCGLGKETFDFVADRNVYKQGRLTPGMHLPIVPSDQLLARRPDFTLLLTWNFADEILKQQKAYRERGGKFVVPIPNVKVI
jgi:hypothetical protein